MCALVFCVALRVAKSVQMRHRIRGWPTLIGQDGRPISVGGCRHQLALLAFRSTIAFTVHHVCNEASEVGSVGQVVLHCCCCVCVCVAR